MNSAPLSRNLSTRIRPALLAGSLSWLASSSISRTATASDDQIRVTATTGQVGDLVRNVGKDLVDVSTLMGPGVDPHLFKPSQHNVIDLIDSKVVFYNGHHLEGKLGEVLEQVAKRRPVVAVAEAIPHDLLETPEEFEGNPDPHVWFDPTMWSYCVDAVVQALSDFRPEQASTFRASGDHYKQQLADLDALASVEFATIPDQQRVLVTAHDAFGYLGRRYDLEVVGLQGISTSTEAGVRDVQRIADLIVERRIPTIFVETSVPRRTIEAVQVSAEDRGWTVTIGEPLYSDALGDAGTPEGTYIGMFSYNMNTIVSGLKGTPS